jgi:uncharacterized protein YjeT (DUF2065 family)
MGDLVVALGLVLVLEGLLWALAPATARRMLEMANKLPASTLRATGWTAVAAGVFLVWLIRG